MRGLTSNAGCVVHDGRVVDKDIDPAPSLDNGLDDTIASLLVTDILGEEDTLST